MIPDYPEMNDMLKRIKTLCEERGWTKYRLSKETGIATSSISNMFSRNTQPSLDTIERLCKGFGISISDFFNTPTIPRPDAYVLNDRESVIIDTYRALPNPKKDLLYTYLHGLAGLPNPDNPDRDNSDN